MMRLLFLWGLLYLSGTSGEVVCGNQQYLPNPYNCSTYYECSNGIPYLMPCPSHQEFSPTTHTCKSPDEAQCKTSVVEISTASTTVVPVTTTSQTTSYYCPQSDDSGAYLYPNPLSCSSFYMCHEGHLELFQCSQGLEYSVTERVCVYPTMAKCDLSNLPTFPNGPTTPASCQANTASTSPTTSTAAGPTPNYYCPEVDGASTYIYASPYSCSSYYMCTEGKLYLFPCPGELEFSATDRICVLPSLSKCDLNHLPTYPTGPTEAITAPNPTIATVTPGPAPNYYCPEVDGASTYIYASPYSCSSYYMCTGGKLYLFPCPGDLEFSATDRICVLPSLSKCDLNHLPTYPTGPTEAITAPNPTIATVTPGPAPNYYCPEVDGASTYIYASPYNCSSYYMCTGGKLYLFPCPGGLDFSVTDRICVLPILAKCDLNNLPSYPTGPTEAITAVNPTTTTVTPGPTPNYYCPEGNNTSQTYLYPNPYSCSSYYMCVDRILYLLHCPGDLEYSVTYKVCALASIAKCDLNNLPSYPTGHATATTVASINTATAVTSVPNYYCPEIDTSITYLYPNPYSCSSYYQCVGGSLHLYQCPDGFEYSVTQRGCDSPSIAKCDLNNLPTFPTGPTALVPTEATTPALVVSSPATTTVDNSVTVHYECPPSESGVYYRYPGDCHRFIECNYGVAEVQSCAANLLFSESKQICDYPQNVPECSTTSSSVR
ncbi:mucin-2-like [Bacillus rossius redtenbacheri]|uniref:mucin-2-like n=1 Tax=Bacillus rossius redtenbacheri TaxID=93214 RepID=UPI002FDDBE6B